MWISYPIPNLQGHPVLFCIEVGGEIRRHAIIIIIAHSMNFEKRPRRTKKSPTKIFLELTSKNSGDNFR